MARWVAIRTGDRVTGRINTAAAPLAYDLGGTLVLSLLDAPRPLAVPAAPDPAEAQVFGRTRSQTLP